MNKSARNTVQFVHLTQIVGQMRRGLSEGLLEVGCQVFEGFYPDREPDEV